jgi:MFS family permease
MKEVEKDNHISFSQAWKELKESPKELYLIFVLKFLESYSYFAMIYTLIMFLSDEFKYTDEQAGWAYGLFGMCTSLYGFIFGGFLIDNLGVKFSLCLGCSILLLGRVLLVISTSHFHILIILYTILPIGTCLGIPVMQIAIRRYTTDNSRSIAFSIFYAMMNVAAIFSASSIDFCRRYLEERKVSILGLIYFDLTPYRTLFVFGVGTTVISLIISLLLKSDIVEDDEIDDNSIIDPTAEKSFVGPIEILKQVTSQRSFWKYVSFIILLMGVRIVYRHLDATFPKYMIREFGKEIMYGSIIAINPFLIVILLPVFAPLSYQFSAYNQIAFGALLTSLSPFFLLFGAHLWSSVMFVVILSIGEALWTPRLYEYTIFITEKGREGTYMALASSPMFVATLITGATSGFLLESYCPENGPRQSWKMWMYIGIITLMSPILLYMFKNKIEITQDDLKKEKLEKDNTKFKKLKEKKRKFYLEGLVIENLSRLEDETIAIERANDFSIMK